MSKISLIVPCYKVEKWLPDCLDSILAQSFIDWEAICVDDGSPDNSGKILDDYAKRDARIKVIHQPNKGLSGARNAAYDLLSSPYVMFVDSDDCLHPETLETAYNTIENTKADMVWFEHQYFDDGDRPKVEQIDVKDILVFDNPLVFYAKNKSLFGRNNPKMREMVWNKICKTELVRQVTFAEGISPGEDNLFTLEIVARIKRLAYLPQKLYFYRMRDSSIVHSMNVQKLWNNWKKLMPEYLKLLARFENLNAISVLRRFVAERVVCKNLLRKYMQQSDSMPQEMRDYIDDLIKNNKIDFSTVRLRYKIGIWCYRHGFMKLCKILIN